ncbi:MAG: signal peptidase I [Clostridia bacterium]|nr:signal peptidase I [Clostridia bacterium]
MAPIININDVVFVKEVPAEEIKIDDIITFRSENAVITHRVTNIDKKNNEIVYTTKGDNNGVEDDEKISFNNVEGKLIGTIPKIGGLVSILKNKIVFTITIVILIACVSYQRKKINKKIERKEKREKYERKLKYKV